MRVRGGRTGKGLSNKSFYLLMIIPMFSLVLLCGHAWYTTQNSNENTVITNDK